MKDIFEFIKKSYSLRINLQFRPEDKIWRRNKEISHRIFFQMNVKLSSSFWILRQIWKLRFQKTVLGVMQSIYSPNFYLTCSHENFQMTKFKYNKKHIYAFIQIFYFSSFLADFNKLFFVSIMWNLFLSTVNKCKISIMIIVIICNVKSFLKMPFLRDFN